MLSDPITLYKLMILYMLAHVNFPLTNSQLTDFFLDHEYTTYFTLQQALNELREAGLLKMESIHNSSRYEITREGEDTLSFFGSNISPAIVSDIDGYLKENKFRLRSEVGVISDFYKSTNQDTSSTARCGREKPRSSAWTYPFPIRIRPRSCAATGRSGARRSIPLSCGR